MPKVNPWNNEIVSWIVYLIFSFVFAFLLYTFFGVLLQTKSPLVIVVSGSMLPTMGRGDVVVLQGVNGIGLDMPEVVLDGVDVQNSSLEDLADLTPQNGGWNVTFKSNSQTVFVPKKGNSDIVVYVSTYKNLEIIHRGVIKIRSDGEYFLLTKGDNNPSLDQDCGGVFVGEFGNGVSTGKSCPSPYPVPVFQVNGKALFWVPYVGYIKLLLLDSWQNRSFWR